VKEDEKTLREVRAIDLFRYYGATLLGLVIVTVGIVLAFLLAPLWVALVVLGGLLLPIYFLLKYHAIGCVLMYKAFAPMSLRDRCRFEPSCSTYMIMAINKYGLFRGVVKGLKRIRRCHPPNGGVDYP
jgi:putative membrane protein insertion efficiency factor